MENYELAMGADIILPKLGPGSNGTANPPKLISLKIQELYRDAIEFQATRQAGKN
jgi:hypothetical protein